MTEPGQPTHRLRTLGRLRPEVGREETPDPMPGYLCERCLDAPAMALVPAPGGGEMGVCRACQPRQAAARDAEAEAAHAAGEQESTPDE